MTLKKASCEIVLLVTLSFAATFAKSEIIRVDFEAEVTFAQNLPIFGISPGPGSPVVGFFIYDTNAPDQDPGDPDLGIYNSGSMGIEIGGLTITNNFTPLQVTFDNTGSNDLWGTSIGMGAGQPSILVDGVPTPDAQLSFSFTQPDGLLTSDAQPSLIDLALLEVSQFNLVQEFPGNLSDRVVIFDKLISFNASVVPIPAAIWLFGTALIGLIGFGKRRKAV